MRTNVELTLDDDDSLEDLTHPEDQEVKYDPPIKKSQNQENGHGVPNKDSKNDNTTTTAIITSDVPLIEYLHDDENDSYGSFGNQSMYSMSSITDGISHVMAHWKVLLFGQLLSVAMAASGASATDLVNRCSLNAPTFQFGLLYFALTGHLVFLLIKHYCYTNSDRNFKYSSNSPYTFPGTSLPLGAPWWFFFVLAILNVEANFFTILAFRYTTLTSITLFDSLAIPAAMFTSKQLLGCKYYPSHIAGAAICFVGVVINVAVDLQIEEEEDADNEADHRMLGDVLAMAGGILYGVNDTLQELMVKKFSQTEFLGLIGFYGTLISIVQVLFLEMEEVAKFFNNESRCETETGLTLLAIFFLATYTNYVGRAKFLSISEAALLNLSLLTADLFSVIFSVFVEHINPNPVFYAALVLIMGGVVVYEIGPSPMVDVNPTNNRRISTSRQLDEFEMPEQISVC